MAYGYRVRHLAVKQLDGRAHTTCWRAHCWIFSCAYRLWNTREWLGIYWNMAYLYQNLSS